MQNCYGGTQPTAVAVVMSAPPKLHKSVFHMVLKSTKTIPEITDKEMEF